MEKTTLISANGHTYERAVPRVHIVNYMNDVALENLCTQTGIEFKREPHIIVGRPETWEQFAKIFLVYNFLTESQNNWDGNIMHLRVAGVCPREKTLYYEQDGKKFEGVK